MKMIYLAPTASLALLLASQAHAAELSGLWFTRSSGGVVEIGRCGETVCGRLVDSPLLALDPSLRDRRNRNTALRARPLAGLIILEGFRGGPQVWAYGSIYNPDDGRTYAGALTRAGENTLKVTACAPGGKCRRQTWTRAAD